MRDASAMGSLQGGIERAALQLRVAIRRAQDGHRGTAISNGSIRETINESIEEVGFVVMICLPRQR
jgi:hypothetical protein